VRHGGRTVEVATFRGESGYRDGRRPEQVQFSDEITDANRRDFTINGLFMHPQTGRVIDHVQGRADLASRTLRAIGDPDARLEEDRLRLLRAARFVARFHMQMHPATMQAVKRHAPELRGVSRERVGHEVRRMLSHATRAEAIATIESLGLAAATLQEPTGSLQGERIARLPAHTTIACALAAWMLDRPSDTPWQQRLRNWTQALVLSNHERNDLRAALHARELLLTQWSSMSVAQRKRLAVGAGFAEARLLLEAENAPNTAAITADLVPLLVSGLAPKPLLDGEHLQRIGLRPGPQFRLILDVVYNAQLEGQICTRAQAESLAHQVAATL